MYGFVGKSFNQKYKIGTRDLPYSDFSYDFTIWFFEILSYKNPERGDFKNIKKFSRADMQRLSFLKSFIKKMPADVVRDIMNEPSKPAIFYCLLKSYRGFYEYVKALYILNCDEGVSKKDIIKNIETRAVFQGVILEDSAKIGKLRRILKILGFIENDGHKIKLVKYDYSDDEIRQIERLKIKYSEQDGLIKKLFNFD